jgi:hypothetical protein
MKGEMNQEHNDYYVYAHFSRDTDTPFYVGFGRKYRMSTKSKRSKEWFDIVNKHGYYYGELRSNMDRQTANLFEKYCIKTFIEIGFSLVNKINGGSGNSKRKKLSKENIQKISLNLKKYWESISEHDRKEFGKMMSSKLKGLKKPKRSEDHIKKQSLSHLGQIPWNKGKINVYSEDTIRLFRKNNYFNRSILVYDDVGNLLYEFESISEASRNLDISRSKISKYLTGRYAKCNYVFKYKEL